MKQYLQILRDVLENGDKRVDRTGVGTLALFGKVMTFDLSGGKFPIITTKKIRFDVVAGELLAFIAGADNVGDFHKFGVNIWDANAQADYWKPKAKRPGDLGRIYGVQWRRWRRPDGTHFDQLADMIKRIKANPSDRRLLVSAWNPGELDQMALPPCHMFFQCFVRQGKYLDMNMYQRSCDMFLGVPFNISSYALFLMMIAQVCDLVPGVLNHILGDAHIYLNHIEQVKEQLSREPKPLPTLQINPDVKDIDAFTLKDFTLSGYEHHPFIKAEMAV